jgi:hypothetical protein
VSTLAWKLTLAPALVTAVSLAGRRWGARAAGLLAGLPVVGGPILLIVTLDHGAAFGARAAISTTLGLVSTMAFCLAYTFSAQRLAWYGSLPLGYGAFFAVTWAIGRVGTTVGAIAASLIALASLGLTLATMPRPAFEVPSTPPRWWDLPLRATFTGALVVGVTTAAHLLGPRWTGLLTPFPIATSVLAVFAHAQTGSPARLLRGLVVGLTGFVAFTTIVATTVERWGVARAFTVGVATAIVVNTALFWLLAKRRRAP